MATAGNPIYAVPAGATWNAGRFPQALSGTITLADLVPSGSIGSNASALSGSILLDDVVVAPPLYAWAASLPTDTWTALAASSDFMDWASAGGIPSGAYRGTAPFSSIVDAFCDPALDLAAGVQYFYGGGHGDGDCNAVCKFDFKTLQWSLVGQPTPPSVFLPQYMVTTARVDYPSGKYFFGGTTRVPGEGGYFLDASRLPNPLDAAYIAPSLARVSTHMYTAAEMRGTKVHYFYLTYAEFDVTSGTWAAAAYGVQFGPMLTAIRPEYNDQPLQQGTVAVYDNQTDLFFVSLVPGDDGGGWRSGVIVFNPNTRSIKAVLETNDASYGLMLGTNQCVKVGRKLYWFNATAAAQQTLAGGLILDMDAAAAATGLVSMSGTHAQRFVLSGFPEANDATLTATQETVPSFWDGAAIRRWNPRTATRDYLYTVNVTPASGAGTPANPYVLTQTRRTLTNRPPGDPRWVYKRLTWLPEAGCAVMVGDPYHPAVALKLS